MSTVKSGFGLLLLLCGIVDSVPSSLSFLQQTRWRVGGDWDDSEVKLCTFGTQQGFDRMVKVFADTEDNTRYVSFAREGYVSDDGFIESMVKCKGSFPNSCHAAQDTAPNGCSTCPCELDSDHTPYGNYQDFMLGLLTTRCRSHAQGGNQSAFHVLVVGLGGGAIAQYAINRCPHGTVVNAVEFDSRMVETATRYFGLELKPGQLSVEQGDGGAVVATYAAEGRQFDVVLIDAFAGGPDVPKSCRDITFVKNIRRILKSNGIVVHNIKVDYDATLPLYLKVFKNAKGEQLVGNQELPSHVIVAGAM